MAATSASAAVSRRPATEEAGEAPPASASILNSFPAWKAPQDEADKEDSLQCPCRRRVLGQSPSAVSSTPSASPPLKQQQQQQQQQQQTPRPKRFRLRDGVQESMEKIRRKVEAQEIVMSEALLGFHNSEICLHFLHALSAYFIGYAKRWLARSVGDASDPARQRNDDRRPMLTAPATRGEENGARGADDTAQEQGRLLREVGRSYGRVVVYCSNFERTSADALFFESLLCLARLVAAAAVSEPSIEPEMDREFDRILRGGVFHPVFSHSPKRPKLSRRRGAAASQRTPLSATSADVAPRMTGLHGREWAERSTGSRLSNRTSTRGTRRGGSRGGDQGGLGLNANGSSSIADASLRQARHVQEELATRKCDGAAAGGKEYAAPRNGDGGGSSSSRSGSRSNGRGGRRSIRRAGDGLRADAPLISKSLPSARAADTGHVRSPRRVGVDGRGAGGCGGQDEGRGQGGGVEEGRASEPPPTFDELARWRVSRGSVRRMVQLAVQVQRVATSNLGIAERYRKALTARLHEGATTGRRAKCVGLRSPRSPQYVSPSRGDGAGGSDKGLQQEQGQRQGPTRPASDGGTPRVFAANAGRDAWRRKGRALTCGRQARGGVRTADLGDRRFFNAETLSVCIASIVHGV